MPLLARLQHQAVRFPLRLVLLHNCRPLSVWHRRPRTQRCALGQCVARVTVCSPCNGQ